MPHGTRLLDLAVYASFKVASTQTRIAREQRLTKDAEERTRHIALTKVALAAVSASIGKVLLETDLPGRSVAVREVEGRISSLENCLNTGDVKSIPIIESALKTSRHAYVEAAVPTMTMSAPPKEKIETYQRQLADAVASLDLLYA